MGRRGRKPRPRYPAADPLYGAPDKPDWLEGIASEHWDELVPQLLERGILTRLDGTALALLCSEFASWRAASAALAKDGPAAATAAGGSKPSPELIAADRHGQSLLKWLREFGLTPLSRSSVSPVVGAIRDPLNDFLDHHPGREDRPATVKMGVPS